MIKAIFAGLSLGFMVGIAIMFVPMSRIAIDSIFYGSGIDPLIIHIFRTVWPFVMIAGVVVLSMPLPSLPEKNETTKRKGPCQCGSGCFTGRTCDYCGEKS